VSQSATSVVPSPTGVHEDLQRQRLRRAVLAGPGACADIDGDEAGGVLELLADVDVVTAALARCGQVDQRRRVLTGTVTVLVILGLCLFRREGYDAVLARMVKAMPGTVAPGDPPPSGAALSKARARIPAQTLRHLFETTSHADRADVPGATLFGLVMTAFDGTVLDLAATDANQTGYATPTGGRYPQARLVTLIACGTRRVLAAATDSGAVSEQALVDTLAGALTAGTLNLADRNFFSMARWIAFSSTGAHLAWRVKNGAKSLPAKIIQRLPDGSSLVRLRESDTMLARRRRIAADPALPRLPDTIARLVEFTVCVTDTHDTGRTRSSRFRVLTTLLDHTACPAREIAQAYAERWQAEVVFLRLKVTLRGAGTRLRGQTPELARQEIWGLLIVYNALCELTTRAAVSVSVDPDAISFTAVLTLTRSHLAANVACGNCGHRPAGDHAAALVTAIAAHPRDRTGRQRASPRGKDRQRSEQTRDVTYTIAIATSNLPKVEQNF
jgi:hypothetical protein